MQGFFAQHKPLSIMRSRVYGTLRAWAQQLRLRDAVPFLEAILQEEKDTDVRLSRLYTAQVNQKAA